MRTSWTKKQYQNLLNLIILFPLTYVFLDIIILTIAGVKWSDFILIFIIANSAKFLGSYLGYKSTKWQQTFMAEHLFITVNHKFIKLYFQLFFHKS